MKNVENVQGDEMRCDIFYHIWSQCAGGHSGLGVLGKLAFKCRHHCARQQVVSIITPIDEISDLLNHLPQTGNSKRLFTRLSGLCVKCV
ncbi:hypothetical protein J4727_12710 [Providencia rettgeri]|uniref:Uncharacterized protein n=1 Tax=Providencia rettgeri TaxID=587 RepID=A0A939NGJ5_PRORE|nr:hypothetical protein [Providencia rettgeri]